MCEYMQFSLCPPYFSEPEGNQSTDLYHTVVSVGLLNLSCFCTVESNFGAVTHLINYVSSFEEIRAVKICNFRKSRL